MNEQNFKDKLDDLAGELGTNLVDDDLNAAIEALSKDLISTLTITYEELNTKFVFKVKPMDLATQIKLETIEFPTRGERNRFVVHQCVVEPKLNFDTISKMPKGMVDSITVFANSLAFSHQTRVQLSSLPEALSENTSGKSVGQSENPPKKS